MGIPDSSLLDLIEKVRSWIFLKASDPTSLSGGLQMASTGCKFCYECEIDFIEFSLLYQCRNCVRLLCGKCVQDYGSLDDVISGDSQSITRSIVYIRSCKFCSNLSTRPKTSRKYSDKIYPAESPRQSPEPPSPSCSGERFDGYSPHAAWKSSAASFSSHPSPVSFRRSFSRYYYCTTSSCCKILYTWHITMYFGNSLEVAWVYNPIFFIDTVQFSLANSSLYMNMF